MSIEKQNPASCQTAVSGCRFVPILFSSPMVEAIIQGRKTQTRRTIKGLEDCTPVHELYCDADWKLEKMDMICRNGQWYCRLCRNGNDMNGIGIKSKYNIGDILWVRETWQETTWIHPSNDEYGYIYKASENGKEWAANDESWKWKPSLFMPKEACRLFLEITDVRIERLQEISSDSIKAEGVSYTIDYYPNLLELWENLWVKINGQQSWDENPFVWAISFKLVECPYGFR